MFEQLKTLILEYVDVGEEELTESARFVEDLGFNSYDFMCLVGEVEDTFEIEVEEREVLKLKTVGDAVGYIQALSKKP